MPENQVPGIYTEETSTLPPAFAQTATAVPAFIGYTQKASHQRPDDLHLIPFKISSMLDYELYFGLPESEKNSLTVAFSNAAPGINASVDLSRRSRFLMHYSLQMYFANGGGPCYILSVNNYSATTGTIRFGQLIEGLVEAAKVKEVTLLLFPDSINMATPEEYYDLHLAAINQCTAHKDRFVIIDVYHVSENLNNWKFDIETLRQNLPSSADLKYAAAYFPKIYSSLDFNYKNEDNILDNEALIAITGIPDIRTLLDLKTANNIKYQQAKTALTSIPMLLPASPAIAGIYALVDLQRGVWKAPANVNINLVTRLEYDITETEQQSLTVDPSGKSVNTIRRFVGRGPAIVWGARTLAGNDNQWRYISVRRYLIMVEDSVKTATQSFVFEPNDTNTWVKVRAMIENFLTMQWRTGALMGVKPEHAYYVRVGLGQTMTASDVLEDRMIIEIGIAVVRPAEFIVIRFAQKMQAYS